MGWALALALLAPLAYWCLLLSRELKALQRWRDDVTEICRAHLENADNG